jgi:hypothetical protein
MGIFSKKQKISLEEFCTDFYEKNILNPVVQGVNAGAVFVDTIKRNVVEVDDNFAKISAQKFSDEVTLLRFELFALAWLHQFGDKLAIVQSDFTKHYLHEKKRDDIWDNSESYNQAIARSTTLGKTPEKAFDRVFLGNRNKTIADLFDQYHAEGCDSKCVARVLNRMFTETAWKKGVAAGLLMFAFCDRLGFEANFEPTKEAQFRLTAIIRGFYDGAKQAVSKIEIISI